MTTQLDLFERANVDVEEPEEMTEVKVGRWVVQIPLRRKRREACKRLMEILAELEGKDIWISTYQGGGSHFWINNLKLPRLQVQHYPSRFNRDPKYIPCVIVLWGSRAAQVRIFTDFLVAIREQEYQGYYHYLLDFKNGLWEHPIDRYHSHYACLAIDRFKD